MFGWGDYAGSEHERQAAEEEREEREAEEQRERLQPDFEVRNEGSLMLVTPSTDECLAWLTEHTDGQWFARALVVEPRYLVDLLNGLHEAGFEGGASC